MIRRNLTKRLEAVEGRVLPRGRSPWLECVTICVVDETQW
jgi:hypothetical protein